MHISLTPRLEAFVKSRVESGLYNNASEVIREALRKHVEHDFGATVEDNEWLETQLEAGLKDIREGRFAEWDEELFEAEVQAERKKRELRRVTNPFKHNPSDKWIKGPFLGEGPLPARVMDAPRRQARRDRERSTFVYDPHGRRVLRKSMGAMRSGPPVEAAMTKLREAAMTSSAYFMDLRDLFDRFDTEQNGFLSRKEMLAAVHSMGVKLTEAEAAALADHFDANGNGTVAFSEFSFGFFNRRSLICKWRMAKGPGMRSDASIMMIFRKYDADASGRLEAGEFARCLSDMGIHLSELELQILAEQFDENRDGYIQPKEFLRFMKKLVAEDAGMKKKNREK